tara:strand:- start:1958 stop:2077 length:120 start_codon:yes stop_codon:yes gene_type:complete
MIDLLQKKYEKFNHFFLPFRENEHPNRMFWLVFKKFDDN